MAKHWFDLYRHDGEVRTDDTTTTTATDDSDDAQAQEILADAVNSGTDWKAEARKWEKRAKENVAAAERLAQIEAANATEHEKAIKTARDEASAETAKKFGERLAAAEIKAALTAIVADPAEIVEDLNLAKYVTDDGEVDLDAVATLREKYAKFAPKTVTPPKPDPSQGAGGGDSKTDFRKADKADVDEELRKLGIRPLR